MLLRLLSYDANWLHITLIAFEFQALQYTLYQYVFETLDVHKWTCEGSSGVQKDQNIVKMHSKHPKK